MPAKDRIRGKQSLDLTEEFPTQYLTFDRQSTSLVCRAIKVYRAPVQKPNTIINTAQMIERASDFSR